jgi:hypothetical protein
MKRMMDEVMEKKTKKNSTAFKPKMWREESRMWPAKSNEEK